MGCSRSLPRERLLRLAREADGRVVADPERRSPGRGAYVCGDPACARRAGESRVLARAFRAPVIIDPETLDFTDRWQRSESTR